VEANSLSFPKKITHEGCGMGGDAVEFLINQWDSYERKRMIIFF
jgi:hypothetical protein